MEIILKTLQNIYIIGFAVFKTIGYEYFDSRAN
jgi:hypothetical protein